MIRHSLSVVHPNAKIGDTVEIGPFTTIEEDVVIGEGTFIDSNVTIKKGTRIGKNCQIFPGAVIGGAPQDLKYQGEETTVEIGDGTTIREYVTINKGTAARFKTTVGSNCLIMAYVHVAHDCEVGNNVILVNNVNLAGEVKVDDWAILGGLTAVHQFCHIGKHAMLSGGSLVRKDVPPFVKAGREPLVFAGINSVGLRRRDFTDHEITEIQNIYRLIYQSGLNNRDALVRVEDELTASDVRGAIVSFIRESQRGIIPVGGKRNTEMKKNSILCE